MGSYLIYITMITICLSSVSNCVAEEVEAANHARLRRDIDATPGSKKTATPSSIPSGSTRDASTTSTTQSSTKDSRPTLRITTIEGPPFLYLEDDEVTGGQKYEGYIPELVSLLADKIGFHYELSLVPDAKYGSEHAEGNWTGMIGQLVNGEVDMAAAPLTITYRREQVVDFSKPFMNAGLRALLKKPTSERHGDLFAFLLPFSAGVWICIFVAFVLVGALLFFLSRLSPYEWRALSKRDEVTRAEGQTFNCLNSFWFAFSTLTLQGYHNSPRSIATRLLSGFWFFFVIVILFAYLANLASFLTMTRMTAPPIRNLNDLSGQTKIKYGIIPDTSTQAFFQHSKYDVFEKMWSFMEANGPRVFVDSYNEGTSKVASSDGAYAFIGESTFLDSIINTECNLYMTSETVVLRSYGLAFPLNYPMTDAVSFALLQLRDEGTLQRLENKWWFSTGICGKDAILNDEEKYIQPSTISLADLSGIFVVLLIGIVLSIPLILCEWLVYNSKHKPKKSNIPKAESGAQTEASGV
ncbi:glutamate receptor 2-like [Glandiceps talaboti]